MTFSPGILNNKIQEKGRGFFEGIGDNHQMRQWKVTTNDLETFATQEKERVGTFNPFLRTRGRDDFGIP